MSLPSWLTSPDPDDTHVEHRRAAQSPDPSSTPRENQIPDPKFLESLKDCKDLESLHKWATEYQVDLRKYARLAFLQLVISRQPLETLLHALEDPALDTSRNLNYLLDQQLLQSLTPHDANILASWIRPQIALGNMRQETLMKLSKFIILAMDTSNDEESKCSLAVSIFEGLQASSVLKFQDVSSSTVSTLLESTTCGLFTRKSQDIGLRIIKALQPAQLQCMDRVISLFIWRNFQAYISDNETERRVSRELEAIPRSFEILRILPHGTAKSVISSASRTLVEYKPTLLSNSVTIHKLLSLWWLALAKSSFFETVQRDTGRKKIEQMLAKQPLNVVVPYLQHLDDRGKVRFMLRYWSESYFSSTTLARVLARFEWTCQNQEEASPFITMLQLVRERLEVPNEMLEQLFTLLQMLQMSTTIIHIIISLRKANVEIDESVILRTINRHVSKKPRLAERILYFYPKIPLEKCPLLAESMILNPQQHPNTALHYCWRRRPKATRPIKGDRQQHLQARAQLLQRMALAYSRAPHLSSRQAFRFAHRCYIFCKRERLGPLGVEMSFAQTLAGIIRPLQAGQWVSTTKLRWVLSVIRSVEGPDVANEVDQEVYDWRAEVADRAQLRSQRESKVCGFRQSPMSFRIQAVMGWSNKRRRFERVFTRLQRLPP